MSETPSLFDQPSARVLGERGLARSAGKHADDIARLVPLAQELAARSHRLTVSDLRIVAIQRGLLTGQEEGKHLCYLPAVMKAAGLRATAEFVRSPIPKTHGNPQRVWVRALHQEAAA